MKTLDYETALRLLREAIEERGADYVYLPRTHVVDGKISGPTCVYAEYMHGEPRPSCGVGVVFSKLGLNMEDFAFSTTPPGYSGKYAVGTANAVLMDLWSDGVMYSTPKARGLLARFQALQDNGTSWGEALRCAVEATAELTE